MPPRARPYDQFGPYILFKRLEAGAIGDLWRAARIDDNGVGPLVALRRFTGGDRAALLDGARAAATTLPQLTGTTFVKAQTVEIIDDVPTIAFEYSGGRSLRHIVDRARGSAGAPPNPIPLDQAILIAERIALSLATTAELKHEGHRLSHGALIPQFVWISDDGDVRLAGQQFGPALLASLADPKVYSDIGHYFAPERRTASDAKNADVYSMGAILFLLITGHEPPDPLSITAFTQAVRAAKTMTGQPLPLEVRTILDKSLTIDSSARYASIGDMKHALDVVAANQSATTFNLAFYITTLLRKELDAEAIDREKETKVSVAAYTAAQSDVAAPIIALEPPQERRRVPIFATAAAVALIAIGAAAVMFMTQSRAATTPPLQPAPPARAAVAAPPPVLATPAVTEAKPDADAARKAFEDAVNRKLQEEMLKLQADFNRDLKKTKSAGAVASLEAPAAVVSQPRPAPAEERAPSAAAFDERRISTKQETTSTVAVAPLPVTQPQPQVAAPSPEPAAPVEQVHEGDIVDIAQLDTAPHLLGQPNVRYPPMAIRQKVESSVIVTALVSENGDVIDVRVLRGDARFGFNEAAIRAVRGVKFSPPIKDGKRVKTWYPQTINFKL